MLKDADTKEKSINFVMTLHEMSKCIKCKQDSTVHIRRTWYCEKCYTDLLKHKFDSAIGQSVSQKLNAKVLLCLDEKQSSLMLLDLCQKYVKESMLLIYKKRSFQMTDLVVAQITDSPKTIQNSFINLCIDDESFSNDLKSCTSKEDVKHIMKFQRFADFAIENG